jgi:glycosyltransferase involved in cell wall biosynthesis
MSGEPLRIAMVSRRVHPAHGPGGMERKVFDLVTRLPGRGVEVDLFTETPADVGRALAASAAMPDGVTVHWVPGRWLPIGTRKGTVVLDRITNYPIWARRVARWMRASQERAPAMVHAHGLAGWGFAGFDVGAPMVLSVEGLEEFEVPPGLKRIGYAPFRRRMRRGAAAAAAVITTDRVLRPVVERHLGIAAADQVVIPNAVDVERCRSLADAQRGRTLLEQLGFAAPAVPDPLFLSVGRAVPNKGFEVLAAALGRAAPRLPAAWAWILVGEGPALAGVRSAVAAAGIAERVRLAGSLPDADLHSLAAAADWFVHPTLYEGSSIATLEAMAHGLPVIASRAGGLPDKVRDGETGYLVPPGEIEPLAEALMRAAAADGPAMGAAGQRLCAAEFAWEVVIDRYVELYRRIAGEPRV